MNSLPEKKQPFLTVKELAGLLGCPYEGNGETKIRGVASLEKAKEGDLVFLAERKYRPLLEATHASCAIIPEEESYSRIPVIRAKNPHFAFIRAVEIFFKPLRPGPGIHPSAWVSPSAKIGNNVSIGAFCYIGDEVEIGDRTIIYPLVSIYPGVKIGEDTIIHSHVSLREGVRIGNRVTIHNGAVIGSDGFGYLQDENGQAVKIPQTGTVVIEDDVEIGASSTIDRASLGETIIGRGTKIDNLVQIAHGVEIGEDSLLAAQTGIAGSSRIGKRVIMGGQVGIADHIKVGDNVRIGAQAGVMQDIPDGVTVSGTPHMEVKEWLKAMASLRRLAELTKEVKRLESRLNELEKK